MKVKHFRDKIVNFNTIEKICRDLRKKNMTIVTTNGCFDILHIGHIEYLQSASDLGDYLVVGINSDKSTRRLKGHGRPVNNDTSRASILASMGFIDYCIIFQENTPVKLLQRIKPNIHVKGGDYIESDLEEKKVVEENGGIIKILPLVQGISTSIILNKIIK